MTSSNIIENIHSKYIGVKWHAEKNKWKAVVNHKGKKIHLGYFDNEISAAKKIDMTNIKYYGEHAQLNFSKNSYEMDNLLGKINNVQLNNMEEINDITEDISNVDIITESIDFLNNFVSTG